MHLRVMITDYWQNRQDSPTEVQNPTWEQVKVAISNLDGVKHTMVTLQAKDNELCQMIISGQWNNCWMVSVTFDSFDFFSLVDPSKSDKKVILFVGGQNGDFEENKCVSLDLALESAKTFFEAGEMKSTLNWTSDY